MNIRHWITTFAVCIGAAGVAGCGGGGGGGGGGGPVIAPVVITAQPAALSVSEGAPASFSVTASGGAPLSYQWKRNAVAIAGATATSYTLAAATSADDGALFSVDVSNAAGTLSSAAAALSVTAVVGRSWGPAALISSGDALHTTAGPQVGIDDAGNAISVWQEGVGLSIRNGAWASRFTAGGGWSTAATIDYATGNSGAPQLAMAPGGVAVASFVQSTSNSGADTRMQARRYDGSNWGTIFRVDNRDAVMDVDHRLVLAPDGVAALAFNQSDNATGRVATVAVSDTTGHWLFPEVIGMAGSSLPQVAVAANGDAVMIWLVDGTPTLRSLFGSRRQGGGWSAPMPIAIAGKEMTLPRLSMDAAGNAIAVWQERPGARNEVHAARLAAGSGNWSAPVALSDGTLQAQQPDLAMTPTGDAIAVWAEADDSGQASSIVANRFGAGTTTWRGAAPVQTQSHGAQTSPRVALDGQGNAIAVWVQAGAARASRQEVWVAALAAASASWATPQAMISAPGAYTDGGDSQAPQIARNAAGDAVVVWVQRSDTAPAPSVWARLYR